MTGLEILVMGTSDYFYQVSWNLWSIDAMVDCRQVGTIYKRLFDMNIIAYMLEMS